MELNMELRHLCSKQKIDSDMQVPVGSHNTRIQSSMQRLFASLHELCNVATAICTLCNVADEMMDHLRCSVRLPLPCGRLSVIICS
jgi:hypothetical protein